MNHETKNFSLSKNFPVLNCLGKMWKINGSFVASVANLGYISKSQIVTCNRNFQIPIVRIKAKKTIFLIIGRVSNPGFIMFHGLTFAPKALLWPFKGRSFATPWNLLLTLEQPLPISILGASVVEPLKLQMGIWP